MSGFLEKAGGNPGRSGHSLSIDAGRIVYSVREEIAELFHAPDPMKVIFTLNGTHAINLALSGLLRAGDHVVTSGIEHNAVMRPLRALEKKGVLAEIVPCAPDGSLDPSAIERAIRPETKLVVINHASNVTGTLLPVAQIAQSVRGAGSLLLVDAAQTAGALPIDIEAEGIDLLAFTGHKGLLGPPGVGGLVMGDRLNTAEMEPLVRGGTGSRSESDIQPEDLPDKFESGTLNGVGIAGLGAGVRVVRQKGVEEIRAREIELTRVLVEGLEEIPGITIYGPADPRCRTAVVSFTAAGRRVSDIGLRLDEEFGILCRVGLHCAPAAHRTIGTFPEGTVRLAPGFSTTEQDIHAALQALGRIMGKSL
jgi:cysteine desulfurase family protein